MLWVIQAFLMPILASGLMATALRAGSTIGNTTALLSIGIPFAVIQVLKPFSWLLSSRIFPRNLESFKDCLSISHVVHKNYGCTSRWISTILTLLTEMGIVIAQMLAVSYILSSMLGLDKNITSIISFLMITIFFSLMGGIRTIVQTGVFQFCLFFLLLPLSYTIISYKYGGVSSLNESFQINTWVDTTIPKSTLMLWAIFSLLPECSSSFIQKCLIARDKEKLEASLKL